MKTLIHHIDESLKLFIDNSDNSLFQNVYDTIKSENKEYNKKLLKYVFSILEKHENKSESLECLNIHFEKKMNDNQKTLLFEFFWNYFFCKHYQNDNYKTENVKLTEEINLLEKQISRPIIAPPNNSRVEFNKLVEKRRRKKVFLKYYRLLNPNTSLTPKTLINLKVSQENKLSGKYKYIPTYLSPNDLNTVDSFVLHNTDSYQSVLQKQLNNEPLFKILDNIILFDCEGRLKRFNRFNFRNLTNFNQNHGTKFKLLLIITFSKKDSLNAVDNRIKRLKEKYYIPKLSSYVITKHETDLLTNTLCDNKHEKIFVAPYHSYDWDELYHKAMNDNFYELRSIKMMNIYSLCYNKEIKKFILDDLFSPNKESHLITCETKEGLLELPKSEFDKLLSIMSDTLEVIIKSDLKNTIIENLEPQTKIILDYSIINNQVLLSLIKKALQINNANQFISWEDLDSRINCPIILLSYRDQGKFNYHFYPNINELNVPRCTSIKSIFSAMFFKSIYNWSIYNLTRNYHNTLNHQIRQDYFKWNRLNSSIRKLRPQAWDDSSWNWDLENDYSSIDYRVTYEILHKDGYRLKYNPSDLIIYKEINSNRPRVETIRWIHENIETDEIPIEIKKIDDLIDEFNPAEKIIDFKKQKLDLDIIRKDFDLEEEDAGRLWKILLKRKANKLGQKQLYNTLSTIFQQNNISIVSYNYYTDTWINPSSDTLVPRGNKVFKVLCDFLKLPMEYRRIIYTIKNETISGKREQTRRYSKLLRDLFSHGCFDEESNPKEILKNKFDYYHNNHNFDELGINEEDIASDLLILIELIKPELLYKEISDIKPIKL